jgi:hypothetical protein
MLTREDFTDLIEGGLALSPYAIVAWGMSYLTTLTIWQVVGGLVVVRLLYAILDSLGVVLSWWLYGRRTKAKTIAKYLRDNEFPSRGPIARRTSGRTCSGSRDIYPTVVVKRKVFDSHGSPVT